MGARLSTFEEASKITCKASKSFRVLYKIDSEEAAGRLSNARMIIRYDDFMIQLLLEKLERGTKLGVKLLSQLSRLEIETIVTIRILGKKKLPHRNELYELVKEMEETCVAIGDLLSILQACETVPRAGDHCHENASRVLKAVGDRRDGLLRLRMSLSPASKVVKATTEPLEGCIQALLNAIIGRKCRGPINQISKVTAAQTDSPTS